MNSQGRCRRPSEIPNTSPRHFVEPAGSASLADFPCWAMCQASRVTALWWTVREAGDIAILCLLCHSGAPE